MRLILHMLGVDDPAGRWYAWWSGPCGDLSLLSAAGVFLRRHNCHVRGCPRIGRHPVDGTTFTVCRKHHPNDHPTVGDVHAAAIGTKEEGTS